MNSEPQLSVVIPAYNEVGNVALIHSALTKVLDTEEGLDYEIIFVNDGSLDDTLIELRQLAKHDHRVRLISFSRNFGKELATTAGIHRAKGAAVVIIDADGQHPVELIPVFLKKWRSGAQVVIGVRRSNRKEGAVKRYGSKLFYKLFNNTTGSHLIPGSTDFRLIDRAVQHEFSRLTERNRITRGLIDWIGYRREIVEFDANARFSGDPAYKIPQLIGLAMNSFISLSLAPLYFSGWAGLAITPLALIAGLIVLVEQLIMHDPLGWNFTGTGMLGILLVFLVGLLLMSQGFIALYISRIHTETQNRPLYVVDEEASVRA